jgi:predicted TIM-barrel fold metal-dependent hydrolase
MRPIRLESIANNFPDLRAVMAHLGATAWREKAAAVLARRDNVDADPAGAGRYAVPRPMDLARLPNWTPKDWDASCRGSRRLVFGTDAKVEDP